MKSGKWHLTDRMELPNQDKIRTLGEKEIYKYLGILETNTIKQVEMKEKKLRKNISGELELFETKLCSRNIIKGINTWAVSSLDIRNLFWSGPEKNLSKSTKEN